MASRSQTVVAAGLAVLGPLVVLGLFLQFLMSYRDVEEATADRNAGRVINARVIDAGVVPVMEAMLDARQPEVIILGPSYANTDVRPEILAKQLGIPPDKVVLLSVPNSVGAHWYAVLQHRVFSREHRPRLVVIVSGLQSMLLTTPLTESSFVNLETQLPPEGDAVVQAKVAPSASLLWARMREQRGKVRARLFEVLRNGPVGLLVESTRGGRMGPIEARVLLDAVFDDSRIDMSLHAHSTPVVEANRGQERYYGPEMLPRPADSFLPDVTALAAAHGARVVWVRPPMSPHIPEYLDDVVLDGVQEEAVRVVAEHGGDYVDMRALPMTSAMFKNEDHMNEEGSRRFSQALAQALLDLDAMEPLADPGSLPPLAPRIEVRGPQPPVPPTLAAWGGTGRWIAPGQTVVWHLDEGWDPRRGTFMARAVAEVPGAQPEAPLAVRAAGRALTQRPGGALDDRQLWVGQVRPPRPDGAFTVEVEVEAGGPWVRLVGLGIGRRLGRSFLVGDAQDLDGAEAPLFGVVKVVDGVMTDQTVRPTYAAEPVTPPKADRELTDLPGAVAAFDTERWAFLSDEALRGQSALGSRCSPLRITEDGKPLARANVPCLEVKREGAGRSCHASDRIFFTASDDTDPASNGRTYRLALDEARRCDAAVWLYPVDRLTVAWPGDQLAGFRAGARYFTLNARYLNKRPAGIRVRLTVDGEAWIDEEVDGRDFHTEARLWRLDRPVLPGAEVVLEIENLAHTFYLLTEATLSERPPAVR